MSNKVDVAEPTETDVNSSYEAQCLIKRIEPVQDFRNWDPDICEVIQ